MTEHEDRAPVRGVTEQQARQDAERVEREAAERERQRVAAIRKRMEAGSDNPHRRPFEGANWHG